MIQITPQMHFVVAIEPADFRRGIDGLARLCQETLSCDPFSGWVFVFRNRRATAMKILIYDGQGFWLCHKRLKPENTRIPGFTEVGRRAHNQPLGVAEARRMVGISR
jgi:transposase